MTAHTIEAVRREITVKASPERAFEVFTAGLNTWWPASHHVSENPLEDVIEPRSGGRVFTRNQATGRA
ncbi:MAG: hypothetical protein ACRDPR_19560 [Nocardioidaceae bacterium]